jgi:DNA-binding PadR family transcriptional regulator
MHPYEISTTLRHRGKEQSIKLNYGSLYGVVGALERHGLIRSRETTRAGRRPERTVYEITDAGTQEYEDWLAELLSMPERAYLPLEAGLSLMPGLAPDDVARLLEGRAERLRVELRTIDATHEVAGEAGLPELFLVESEYRRVLLNAELEYVSRLAGDIRSDRLGGIAVWRRMHELHDQGLSFEEMFADPAHLGEEAAILRLPPPKS